jgi:hypothetical protein
MRLTMGKRQRALNTASECAGMRLTTRSKLFGQEIWIIVELLVEKHNSVAVFSFGSRARGDLKPWSIYDLSIIADLNEQYLDKIRDMLSALNEVDLPVEPHSFTLIEALDMLSKGNSLILNALMECLVPYSRLEFNLLVEKFNEMIEKGSERTETSIILPRDNVE